MKQINQFKYGSRHERDSSSKRRTQHFWCSSVWIRRWCTALCVLTVVRSHAEAGFIDDHAYTGVWSFAGGPQPGFEFLGGFNHVQAGATSAFLAGSETIDGEYYILQGAALASASIKARSLLRSAATASASGFTPNDGNATAHAAWRDVAFLATNAVAPPTLRLHFEITALLSAGVGGVEYGRYGLATLQVGSLGPANSVLESFESWLPGFNGLHNYYGEPAPFVQFSRGTNFQEEVETDLQTRSWDSIEIIALSDCTRSIRGQFHFDYTYDESVEGYIWGIGTNVFASAVGGSAGVDSMNSLSILSATDTEGNPIDVVFESGLSLSSTSVPEPASMALLGLTAVGVGVVRCRRRRVMPC